MEQLVPIPYFHGCEGTGNLSSGLVQRVPKPAHALPLSAVPVALSTDFVVHFICSLSQHKIFSHQIGVYKEESSGLLAVDMILCLRSLLMCNHKLILTNIRQWGFLIFGVSSNSYTPY